MKTRLLGLLLVLGGLFLAGCEECYDNDCTYVDDHAPAAPTDYYSVTGDGEVALYWDANQESDLDGYKVYWNDKPSGYFKLITFTKNNYYIDRNVTNGQTYFYAVSAVDYSGNESAMTYGDIFDTPRPEGYNQRLMTYNVDQWANEAGWDFDFERVRYWNDPRADIYYEYIWDATNRVGHHYLNVTGGDVQIQYWDIVDNLDAIDWAPETGWNNVEWYELREREAYVLRIRKPGGETHYAKIQIRKLDEGVMYFDWAYQIDPDNRELIIGEKPKENSKS